MLWLHEDLHVRSHADAPVLCAHAAPVVQAQGEVFALEGRSLRTRAVSRFTRQSLYTSQAVAAVTAVTDVRTVTAVASATNAGAALIGAVQIQIGTTFRTWYI